MYINFLTSLIILVAAFQLLLMIVAFPFALLDTWITMRSSRSTNRQSVVLKQVMLSVVLAAFVAIICAFFASLEGVEHRWVYAGTGFVATCLVLVGNTQFQRAHVDPSAYPDIQELQSASAEGAVLGLPVGLVIYPLVYLWPRLFTFIPGAFSFFSWSVNLADWLGSFWLIRAIAFLSAAGYIFNAGLLALFSAGILGSSVRTALKALFSSQPGGQVQAP